MTDTTDTPWEVRVKDRGHGHLGPYGIADRHGTLLLEDISLELATRIVEAVNAVGATREGPPTSSEEILNQRCDQQSNPAQHHDETE